MAVLQRDAAPGQPSSVVVPVVDKKRHDQMFRMNDLNELLTFADKHLQDFGEGEML
jgi:hypothetical protein